MSTPTSAPLGQASSVKVCIGHTRPVVHLAYSNIIDGSYWMISSCKDGKPMIRNGESGDWVGTFEGHKGAIWSACLNEPATLAATASADFTAKVWDAVTGEEKQTFEQKGIVKAADFSKDSTKLAIGGMEKKIKIYDLQRPGEHVAFDGHTQAIQVILYHKNDVNLLLSCARDKTLKVWDVRTPSSVKTIETDDIISSMEVSPFENGKYLTAALGKKVVFYDTTTFEVLKEHAFSGECESASLDPKGRSFILGGDGCVVKVCNFANGEELESLKGHHGPVHVARFAPDGSSFASGSEDGTIRIWPNSYVQSQ